MAMCTRRLDNDSHERCGELSPPVVCLLTYSTFCPFPKPFLNRQESCEDAVEGDSSISCCLLPCSSVAQGFRPQAR